MNKYRVEITLECLWHIAVFLLGWYLIALTHYNASTNVWYTNDSLAGISMAQDVFVKHHSLFLWHLHTTTWLLELIPLWLLSLVSSNSHIWEMGLAALELIWLIWLFILLAISVDNRRVTRLIMTCSAFLLFVCLAHFEPGDDILLSLLITTFFSIPTLLVSLSVLLICFSELRQHQRFKTVLISLLCLITTACNPLFLINFALPFCLAIVRQGRARHLLGLILISSAIGFIISHCVHWLWPKFILKTPWTFNSPSTVLHYLYNISASLPNWWFVTLAGLGCCFVYWLYPSRKQTLQLFFIFTLCIAFVSLVGMFFDHDVGSIASGKYFAAQNHYLMLCIIPIFMVLPLALAQWRAITSPMVIAATLLIIISQIGLLIQPPQFKAFFATKGYVRCLERIQQQYHLHDGLAPYNEMRLANNESNAKLSISAFDTHLKPYSFLNTQMQYRDKHFDYVIADARANKAQGIVPYDFGEKLTKHFGKPDDVAHCSGVVVYIYRKGQLDQFGLITP